MKRLIVFLGILLVCGMLYADEYKANSYQDTTFVNTTQLTSSITFDFPCRELTIINADSDMCWVNIHGTTMAAGRAIEDSGAFLMRGSSELTFRDYMADSISFGYYTAEASPISVIANY